MSFSFGIWALTIMKSLKDLFTNVKYDATSVQTFILSDNSFVVQGHLPKEVIPPMDQMMQLSPGIPDTVIMLGKPVLTPRFVVHYLKPYYYTGRIHEAKPLPSILEPLMNWANETTDFPRRKPEADVKFNQVLLNFYMDGNHYIGRHSDDERQLVSGSSIFSASVGETRTFRIRNKKWQFCPRHFDATWDLCNHVWRYAERIYT